MEERRTLRTPRQKYGEELRLRRIAAGLTQEELSDQVVCSPTLISHFEAGRRLPKPDDAQRIDRVLGTDGFFARWLEDLESKYTDHFATVANPDVPVRDSKTTPGPTLVFSTHGWTAFVTAVKEGHIKA